MKWYRLFCHATLALWFGLVAPATANEVVLELTPVGSLKLDIVRSLNPAIEPDLAGDIASATMFDESGPTWTFPLSQLSDYRTRLSLRIEGEPPHRYPSTPLNLSLPYRSQKPLRIVLPFVADFDNERLKAVYRNEAISTTPDDFLGDFLHATMRIDFLTANELPEIDGITRNLVHSLVIYGNSMARLIGETEWFGIPADFETKREMMQRAVTKANFDDRFASQISVSRLEDAKQRAERATHQLYGRYFRAIADLQGDIQCNEIFPIALPFYEHLRDMQQDRYAQIREHARFTRSQVLNETVRCFDLLLSRRDGARVALQVVIERKFGGLDAKGMHALLYRYLSDERRQIIREIPGCPGCKWFLYSQRDRIRDCSSSSTRCLRRHRLARRFPPVHRERSSTCRQLT